MFYKLFAQFQSSLDWFKRKYFLDVDSKVECTQKNSNGKPVIK